MEIEVSKLKEIIESLKHFRSTLYQEEENLRHQLSYDELECLFQCDDGPIPSDVTVREKIIARKCALDNLTVTKIYYDRIFDIEDTLRKIIDENTEIKKLTVKQKNADKNGKTKRTRKKAAAKPAPKRNRKTMSHDSRSRA